MALSLLPVSIPRKFSDIQYMMRPKVNVVGRKVNSMLHRLWLTPDKSIMDEDWDTLILLDGCRYDSFNQLRHLLPESGRLKRRTSVASSSLEFMERTFTGHTFHDTVYVTANPHVDFIEDDIFHAVWSLLDDKFWDAELCTVRPETVAEQGLLARDTFPHKRLILHFMQPHYPFIGEQGQRLTHRGYNQSLQEPEFDEPSIWALLRRDPTALDISDVRDAYHENLEIVLNEVIHIFQQIPEEKRVVTADHGNFLGERQWPIPVHGYGHPPNAYAPSTLYVPWFEQTGTERPEIYSESPINSDSQYDNTRVTNRLEALGYKE